MAMNTCKLSLQLLPWLSTVNRRQNCQNRAGVLLTAVRLCSRAAENFAMDTVRRRVVERERPGMARKRCESEETRGRRSSNRAPKGFNGGAGSVQRVAWRAAGSPPTMAKKERSGQTGQAPASRIDHRPLLLRSSIQAPIEGRAPGDTAPYGRGFQVVFCRNVGPNV